MVGPLLAESAKSWQIQRLRTLASPKLACQRRLGFSLLVATRRVGGYPPLLLARSRQCASFRVAREFYGLGCSQFSRCCLRSSRRTRGPRFPRWPVLGRRAHSPSIGSSVTGARRAVPHRAAAAKAAAR